MAVEQAASGSSITTTSTTTLNKAGAFNYTITVDNFNNDGADFLVAAYGSSGALIGWQVVNRANNIRNNSYNGSFNLNAANPVDTTSITIRAWQGTAGSSYGTGNDNTPAITYGTGNLTAGATTGFVPNSISAPSGNNGSIAFTGTGTITITGGSTLSASSVFGVDTIAPTVTDANISISGGTGTSGAYKIGDTVTAVYDPGSQGSELSSVTVDFSQFGGGTAVAASLAASGPNAGKYVATYTIVGGSIDTTSRNVSVTATDNAGNTTTAADTSNATVDNIAPAAPSFSLATDSGSSSSDGITNVGTVNVTGVESGATWQYTTNGNAGTPTWNTGSGSSFTLAAGTYATGAVRVRQTDLAGNTTTTP
ncbi:MAG: hypothetical protein ACK5FE_10000, partial [Cyanobacteriota bacterium]